MNDNVTPVVADVPDLAKRHLHNWLQANGYQCLRERDWARWEYCDPAVWTVYVSVFHMSNFWGGLLGMHIYDDGRVVCVSKDSSEAEAHSS